MKPRVRLSVEEMINALVEAAPPVSAEVMAKIAQLLPPPGQPTPTERPYRLVATRQRPDTAAA